MDQVVQNVSLVVAPAQKLPEGPIVTIFKDNFQEPKSSKKEFCGFRMDLGTVGNDQLSSVRPPKMAGYAVWNIKTLEGIACLCWRQMPVL